MSTVTAKRLHQETRAVLNQLEQGESMIITRNGRRIGRMEPVAAGAPVPWDEIMGEVWRSQKALKPGERVPNPVLEERKRRRR
jgi:antitoxin (DNA-binding transcriptional repressor) of toxin-antitoxin stability system